MSTPVAWLVVLVVAIVAWAACGDGGDRLFGPPGTTPLADGETLGAIERLPGGTPVLSDVRTFLDLACDHGVATVRTSAEVIIGAMPCDRMPPQSIIDGFVSRPVAITYAGGRLRIENPEAGTLDLPIDDAGSMEANDGAP